MSVILYINGQRIETDSKTLIAQTKQVNDIANLSNRQCSFTNKFKVPKTSANIKALEFMTIPGNTSLVPYKKNECFLQSENGQNFVHKGWAIVSDNGTTYEIVVYDGIIDLFKEIENKTMAELNLSAINQPKSIENIIDSWSAGDKNYRYLIADYNGDVSASTSGEINIDYLVPSAWIPYLWEQLREYLAESLETEVIFEGSVFNSPEFKSLYMSYPKGLESTEDDLHLIFHSNNYDPIVTIGNSLYQPTYASTVVNELAGSIESQWLKVADEGTYKMNIKGRLYGKRGELHENSRINIRTNGENISYSSLYNSLYNITSFFEEGSNILTYGEDFEIESKPFYLEANDTIGLLIANETENEAYQLFSGDNNYLEVKLYKINPVLVNFNNELKDFTLKDFLNEIVQRFGLTIFKDPYSQTYTFLTMQELLQNTEYVDWSNKYISTEKQDYKVANYAQRNYMRYKYNDTESSYNDGYIGINNVNLSDKKDIVKSKMYSPERYPKTYFGNRLTNTYKLWDKELKEVEANEEEGIEAHTETEYKSLDKRFYIMRAEQKHYTNVGLSGPFNIISKELLQSGNPVSTVHFESFSRQKFQDIIQDYYQPISKILNKSIIVSAKIWLTDSDIINFDFTKLYYIKQLSNYFLVNKINNFTSGKPTKVELIRVIHAGETQLPGYEYGIVWLSVVQSSQYGYWLNYNLLYEPQEGSILSFEISQNGQDWQTSGITTTSYSTYFIELSSFPNTQYLRIHDPNTNTYSDTYLL